MPALSVITHMGQKPSWMRIPQERIAHRECADCGGLASSGVETPSEALQPLVGRPGLLYPQLHSEMTLKAEDIFPEDTGARSQGGWSQAWLGTLSLQEEHLHMGS